MSHAVWNAMQMVTNTINPHQVIMSIRSIIKQTEKKQQLLATGAVVPDKTRCVQCGICSFNCPLGVDVRGYAMRGLPVIESACLTCGECVRRCPRGVLHFDTAPIMKVPAN